MDSAKLRGWYAHRQGLLGGLEGVAPERVLEQIGWARSVGGVNPYLALFARAGTRRAEVDRAAEELRISELPSARACTYVMAKSDFALALSVARPQQNSTEWLTARKLGVTEDEIGILQKKVVEALADGTKDPAVIRKSVGDASRNLGEEGKIVRRPVTGRFDSQRYAYALWADGPLTHGSMAKEEAFTELGRKFFRWSGPASVAQFAGYSALSKKAATAALEPLNLVPITEGSDSLLLPDDLEPFRAFFAPTEPDYRLIGSLDNLLLPRRDASDFCDPADLQRPIMTIGEKGAGSRLEELNYNAIVDRGRIVGLWEYEVASTSVVWQAFIELNDDLRKAVARTEAFIRDQLGDSRTFSLDSPESRKPKIERLRGG